jgi:ABC-type transport system, involved in lipoprotein release, permease component
MATMLLLVGFASKSSIDFMLNDTYGSTYKYQYQYLFNTLQQGKPAKGEAFTISSFNLDADNKTKFAVYGMSGDDKFVYLNDKEGNQLHFNNVIITKPLAEKLKVKPQDTIAVVNVLDSKKYTIKVDYIAESYIGEFIYMPIDELNNMLKLPQYSYIGIWSNEKLKIPENKLLNTASIDDFKNAFNSMTEVLQFSIGSVSLMSFLIGIIVIYVVTSMIIEENRKSISLMKVLGYKRKEVYSLILNSSSFIIILGYIIGVPLVTVSLDAMYKSVASDINIVFPIKIDYSYILVGFICIYLTYEISKAISKRKVNKISMNEILKSIHE